MEQSLLVEEGIVKRVIYAGRGDLPQFALGTKLCFHYVTKLQDEEGTVLDDSKKTKPMEIIIGKKFKLEVWEKCLKSMRVDEVAEFRASRIHCAAYPAVAKTLREFHKGKEHGDEHNHQKRSACCAGSMLQSAEGLGHEDLNSLMKDPQPLIFVLQLLSVSQPGEYEKEMWQMDEREQEAAVPVLREQGNSLFRQKKFEEASKKYGEALSILENCALREKPNTPEWENIESAKIPLLLNFSQCHLILENYSLVIEHTSTVVEKDGSNVKAFYRRGKAYGFTWEMARAKEDLLKVKKLDPSLSSLVDKDLTFFDRRCRDKDKEQMKILAGKIL